MMLTMLLTTLALTAPASGAAGLEPAELRARDSDNGEAIAASLRVIQPDGTIQMWQLDEAGSLTLHLPPGAHTVTVSSQGHDELRTMLVVSESRILRKKRTHDGLPAMRPSSGNVR